MAPDSLNADYEELRAEVGFYRGYGRGNVVASDSAWTTTQTENIEAWLKSGLRRFYKAHDWTFLRPRTTLTFASAAQTIVLPDDFASLDGLVTVGISDGALGRQLAIGSAADVAQRYAQDPDATGLPQFLCEETVADAGRLPPRRRWRVWPAADQAYTFTFQYRIHGRFLSGMRPYAYGGAEHAETIVQAALAAAELKSGDGEKNHEQAYQGLLADSIRRDRRNQPQSLGMNQAPESRNHNSAARPFLPVMIQGTIY